ncbi:hypothetical protein D9619_009637 [Psilocybe cf. subviscida]|uniref:Uncharacterized protein n=1 Tax=Psilocybe cf. subviscida TaxID=2480587 RepID=A0A8H5F6J4_9AGAR|nr:hypothetical protein D9619_009637 [Psilocybe cf. subviscida]
MRADPAGHLQVVLRPAVPYPPTSTHITPHLVHSVSPAARHTQPPSLPQSEPVAPLWKRGDEQHSCPSALIIATSPSTPINPLVATANVYPWRTDRAKTA